MMTNGIPGIVTPVTLTVAPITCASHHTDGISIIRCGSFANRGRPLEVRAPLTTQLLLSALASEDNHSRPGGHADRPSSIVDRRSSGFDRRAICSAALGLCPPPSRLRASLRRAAVALA